jgi:hypothetical protein
MIVNRYNSEKLNETITSLGRGLAVTTISDKSARF